MRLVPPIVFLAAVSGCSSVAEVRGESDDVRGSILASVLDDISTQMASLTPASGAFVVVVLPPELDYDFEPPEQGDGWEEAIAHAVLNRNSFRVIDSGFVKAALREAGIAQMEKLYLPQPRRDFLAQLEGNGTPPDYLFHVRVTGRHDVKSKLPPYHHKIDRFLEIRAVNTVSGQMIARSGQSRQQEWLV